jgi:hypothetical protein
MYEFERLDPISKLAYAYKIKMNYYKFCHIRPMLRGFSYIKDNTGTIQRSYCPLCKKETNLVSIGMMNKVFYNRLISYPRCEYCCLKLPVKDKKILKLLGLSDKKHKELPIGQLTL